MKFVMATGGSGGHLFPAIYVAQELKKQGHEIHFVGAFANAQERIAQAGFPYRNLNTRGLNKKSLKSILEFSGSMLQSILVSLKILKEIKPQVVCGFGSYGSFPVILSAFLLRCPTIIHEQNVIPGRANRALFPFVNKVAVSFDVTRTKFFKGKKTVLTGCPCHSRDQNLSKATAAESFGLDPNKLTILVLGGSQGSHGINIQFIEAIPLLKKDLNFQVIHLSGQSDFTELKQKYPTLGISFRLFDFLGDMKRAYTAADVVISRAGAVTVTELAQFGLPAILIPYPYAGAHQKFNAGVLVEAKTAVMVEEKDVTPLKLSQHILKMLVNRTNRQEMEKSLAGIYLPDAAVRFAREAVALAK